MKMQVKEYYSEFWKQRDILVKILEKKGVFISSEKFIRFATIIKKYGVENCIKIAEQFNISEDKQLRDLFNMFEIAVKRYMLKHCESKINLNFKKRQVE